MKDKQHRKEIPGIEQPLNLNTNIKRKRRPQLDTPDVYVKGILNGDTVCLSKAITLLESLIPKHRELAQEIIKGCLPHSGRAIRVGITGVPGAGKSTFIDALGSLLTSAGKRVAVLAIDPSSQRSKGSILGDKTRMERLAQDPKAFIRPSPNADSLGGVAQKTRETMILCEAASYDVILVETVGVGQSEIAVRSMVDFFLLLQIAGAGDELQGIKRGIMEMADAIVVNKCDGDNISRAQLTARQLQNALSLFSSEVAGWNIDVLTCSALEGISIEAVWEHVMSYVEHVKASGYFLENRNQQAKSWMYEMIDSKLKQLFYENQEIKEGMTLMEQDILNNEKTSFQAANLLIEKYLEKYASK